MKKCTVTIAIRIRLASGERRYSKPVFAANGKIKPLYAFVGGQPEHHPEGVYTLRYKDSSAKGVWENVGPDASLALTAKLQRKNVLEAEALGLATPTARPGSRRSEHAAQPLTALIDVYLAEVRRKKRNRTLNAYRQALTVFAGTCRKRDVTDVNGQDVEVFIETMKRSGHSARTIANRVTFLRTFLRWAGSKEVVTSDIIPRYTKKVVRAYSLPQVRAILECAEDRLVWDFFIGSGGREQEVMYATWTDIDFDNGLFLVREKVDLGFRIKDGEERDVPLPDSLLDALRERRQSRPMDRFLFPTAAGKPDGHLLRKLKRTAFRAGLNCGQCKTKRGVLCSKGPTCKTWELHKFRKTFATMHHESGVSPRTLMKWLGHSDFTTTLHYLEAADVKSAKTRSQVNNTFAQLAA